MVSRQYFHCLGLVLGLEGYCLVLSPDSHCLSLGVALIVLLLMYRDQDSSRHLMTDETHKFIHIQRFHLSLQKWMGIFNNSLGAAE